MENKNAFSRIRAENHSRIWSKGCIYGLTTQFLAILIAAFMIIFFKADIEIYVACINVLGFGAWLSISIFLICTVLNKQSITTTACKLDDEFYSRNRLETIVELKNKPHPLREAQLQETEVFLSGCSTVNWTIWKWLFLFTLIVELGTGVFLWKYTETEFNARIKKKAAVIDKKHEDKKQRKEAEKKKELVKDKPARLKLISPESEIKKRPLDEIEWEGTGFSPRGFKELKLIVHKNGEKVEDYDLKPQLKGKLKFSDVMALDEFDSIPYDLISYHLEGRASVNGRVVKVLSLPQFIEVRPFREDAKDIFVDGQGGGVRPPNILITFLNMQVMLHKITFTARIARQMEPDKEQKKLLNKVYNEQQFLHGQLMELLNHGGISISEETVFELKSLPAESVNCLEKAAVHMKHAVADLKKVANGNNTEGNVL